MQNRLLLERWSFVRVVIRYAAPLRALATTAAVSVAIGMVPASDGKAASAERPNIVMIFTDDQRFDAVGYSGNTAVTTPNLDRLARGGLVFQNCFVNTSICAISRTNLLTGQYPARHGVEDFFATLSRKQLRRSVPGRLQAAGYQTAFFGKWGIGDSPAATHKGTAAFDYWAGQPMQTCFFHDAGCRYVKSNGFSRDPKDLCNCPADARGRAGFRNRSGRHGLTEPLHVDSDVVPMHVDRFLDGRDSDKPFCMMLFFKAPHAPFGDWDPEHRHATDNLVMPRPPAATLANARREPDLIKRSLGAVSGRRYVDTPEMLAEHLRDYYRLVTSMDEGVGKVVSSLEGRGLADDTVILFTSDNGHFKGEHGLAGKWLMYEPSLRVPGFLYDPRRTGGRVTTRMVITTDFSVTMLALAGIKAPSDMTGRDLTTLADDPVADWRGDFYYDHPYGHRGQIPTTEGVRTERYTYTRYPDAEPPFEQLFDLHADRNQLENLAKSSGHYTKLMELRRRCDALAEEVGPIR